MCLQIVQVFSEVLVDTATYILPIRVVASRGLSICLNVTHELPAALYDSIPNTVKVDCFVHGGLHAVLTVLVSMAGSHEVVSLDAEEANWEPSLIDYTTVCMYAVRVLTVLLEEPSETQRVALAGFFSIDGVQQQLSKASIKAAANTNIKKVVEFRESARFLKTIVERSAAIILPSI